MAVRVLIYDTAIERFTQPGGGVYRYVRDKSREVQRTAQVMAPKRTTHLAGTISRSEVSMHRAAEGIVSANAHYAIYVHDGTGRIYAHSRRGMSVPRSRWPAPQGIRVYRQSVAGQRPQPFLVEALAGVMGRARFMGGRRL